MNFDYVKKYIDAVMGAISFLNHLHPQWEQNLPTYKDIQNETSKLLRLDWDFIQGYKLEFKNDANSLKEYRELYSRLLFYVGRRENEENDKDSFKPYFFPIEAVMSRKDFQSMNDQEQSFWLRQALILEDTIWDRIEWVNSVTSEQTNSEILSQNKKEPQQIFSNSPKQQKWGCNTSGESFFPRTPFSHRWEPFLSENGIIPDNLPDRYFINCLSYAEFGDLYQYAQENKKSVEFRLIVDAIIKHFNIKDKNEYRLKSAKSMGYTGKEKDVAKFFHSGENEKYLEFKKRFELLRSKD